MNPLYIVLAGGKGERLMPLTEDKPKPLVRFGAKGTIIDSTLFNCLVSNQGDVVVQTQSFAEMMERYVRIYWDAAFRAQGRKITTLTPQPTAHDRGDGVADAVGQALSGRQHLPEVVMILAGSHIYRMDYRHLLQFHRSHGGAATVGVVEHPNGDAAGLARIQADAAGRVTAYQAKPPSLQGPSRPRGASLTSMGIYAFDPVRLMKALAEIQSSGPRAIGDDLLPALAAAGDVFAYPFRDHKGAPGYWREVSTLEDYWRAHMELLEFKKRSTKATSRPGIRQLPFFRSEIINSYDFDHRTIVSSVIATTAKVGASRVEKSVLGPAVTVGDQAVIRNSILLDGASVPSGVEVRNRVVMSLAEVTPGCRGCLEIRLPEGFNPGGGLRSAA
jgi:glucose-1-phosphate adenylyltransferase